MENIEKRFAEFKDANYFSKAFKKKYNLTPSEYREKNRSLR